MVRPRGTSGWGAPERRPRKRANRTEGVRRDARWALAAATWALTIWSATAGVSVEGVCMPGKLRLGTGPAIGRSGRPEGPYPLGDDTQGLTCSRNGEACEHEHPKPTAAGSGRPGHRAAEKRRRGARQRPDLGAGRNALGARGHA